MAGEKVNLIGDSLLPHVTRVDVEVAAGIPLDFAVWGRRRQTSRYVGRAEGRQVGVLGPRQV